MMRMVTTHDNARTRKPREFYETIDRSDCYAVGDDPARSPFFGLLMAFVDKWQLQDKAALEIGSAKGLFQDVIEDYTGVDLASSLSVYYHKPFVAVADARLPFPDASFDAVFSRATYEHIPDINIALEELVRVLKPGGVCLLAPAWHTRPWFAGGYAVRPYSALTLPEKLVKVSIPIRNSMLIRYPFVLCRRIVRLGEYVFHGGKPRPLRYRKLDANYQQYWQSDSDACNSLDPFDVILWFRSRGFVCHGYGNLAKSLLARALALELQKPLI